MVIRVAVATNSGSFVDEHFGKAKRFNIYQLDGQEWRQVDVRQNDPACSCESHSDDLLDRTADLVNDCQGVIISQIGPGAMDTLLSRNIMPFALEGSVDEALATVLQSKLFRIRYKLK